MNFPGTPFRLPLRWENRDQRAEGPRAGHRRHRGSDGGIHIPHVVQRERLCRGGRQLAPLYAVVRRWRAGVIQPLWEVDVVWCHVPACVFPGRAQITTLQLRGRARIEVDARLPQRDAESALTAALASLSMLELQLQCEALQVELEAMRDLAPIGSDF
jgi:hypothetical protein